MNNYQNAVRSYIAKSIEELYFEDLIELKELGEGRYEFSPCDLSVYQFQGRMGSFDNLWMDSSSLENKNQKLSVSKFLKDIQSITKMDDLTLAQFAEEANQTLYGDVIFLEKSEKGISSLMNLNYHEVDSFLPGHPKIMNNKGRLGWGMDAIKSYAPESNRSFQLHWIAARKDQCLVGVSDSEDQQIFMMNALSLDERKIISEKIDLEKYLIFPVHPWQWDRYIRIQFAEMIENEEIISLGPLGPSYSPQASIRTLSNRDNDKSPDMKLSLSILNTSTYRGIPRRFIENGHLLSDWFRALVQEDPFLKEKVKIARESGAVSVSSSSFDTIEKAPARFKEMLGCICRESVPSLLEGEERAIPTAGLFFKCNDFSLAKSLIESSGLSAQQWVREYFDHVVIPLYHLQLKHGIGIVSHGQNIILIVKEGRPKGMILKDFHGDLRLNSSSVHLGESAVSALTVLPPEYLIHDLITGHFVTVLRYFSRVLEESMSLREQDFYSELKKSILNYFDQGIVEEPQGPMNLLREEFEKLQVNNVRFQMGYQENSGSPKPLVGRKIKNPIVKYR